VQRLAPGVGLARQPRPADQRGQREGTVSFSDRAVPEEMEQRSTDHHQRGLEVGMAMRMDEHHSSAEQIATRAYQGAFSTAAQAAGSLGR